MTDDMLVHPRQKKFYLVLGFLMTLTSIGDRRWWGMEDYNVLIKTLHRTLPMASVIVLISQMAYTFIHFKEMSEFSQTISISIIPVNFMISSELLACKQDSYKEIMVMFMDQIHLYNFRDGSEFIKKKILTIETKTYWTSCFMACCTTLTFLTWSLSTTFYSIDNNASAANRTAQLQTVLNMLLPYDYRFNINYWLITQIFSVFLAWLGLSLLSVFSVINIMFVYHFTGHIEVFKFKIRNLDFTHVSNEGVKLKLVGVIKYHLYIIEIFHKICAAFGTSLAVLYLYNLIGDSFVLYQIMVGEATYKAMYVPLMAHHAGTMVLVSFALEEIRRQTEDIPDLVYLMPWEKMSISNQKIVLITLANVKNPLIFKATGGFIAGVNPMISILKSTFSYYVMLRSMNE